jgi:hexosaminidase
MRTIPFLIAFLFSLQLLSQSIIPQPNSMEYGQGFFKLDSKTAYQVQGELAVELEHLQTYTEEHYGFRLRPATKQKQNLIVLQLDVTSPLDEEAYILAISPERIQFTAATAKGVFYGLQSLRQLMATSQNGQIPAMKVEDSPRFAWRGMHLDVSRHFFTLDDVKKYLDYMAMYKMNSFHWHLTEDQGWRIEIKKYPLLTEVGAWRDGTMVGHYSDHQYDTIRYGGFYTQAQIKEVVDYATARHINVVPEIEMPGHSLAALSAYPEYSCTGGPFTVAQKWGVFDDVYCAGNDATFQFLQDILDEVMALFPSTYLHIGGDECPKTRWKECAKCQQRIKDEGLADEHELQSYFIQRIEKYVNSKGKRIIGWDEILEGGLAPNATVMSWRGTEGGIAAAKAGHQAVMSPGSPCYFDHYQSKDKSTEPIAIGGYNPLSSVYAYEPIPDALTATESRFILGAQGNVWTEYMKTFEHVQYMALPRMTALSEVLWTHPEQKDYADFLIRLKQHTKLLDKMGVNYAKHFLEETP